MYPPSLVVTVIVVVPADFPVTTPPLTVATDEFDDVHVTSGYVVLEGVTVAVSVSELLVYNDKLVLFKEIPVGLMMLGFSTTLTFTVAVSPLCLLLL